jgi:hypothetical protein
VICWRGRWCRLSWFWAVPFVPSGLGDSLGEKVFTSRDFLQYRGFIGTYIRNLGYFAACEPLTVSVLVPRRSAGRHYLALDILWAFPRWRGCVATKLPCYLRFQAPGAWERGEKPPHPGPLPERGKHCGWGDSPWLHRGQRVNQAAPRPAWKGPLSLGRGLG